MQEIINKLRELFPDGDPEFVELAIKEMDLYSRKNHDYSGNELPFGNFQRVACILSLYPGLEVSDSVVVSLIYLLKQLDAVLRLKASKTAAKVEGIDSRLADIGVYAKIARIMEARK